MTDRGMSDEDEQGAWARPVSARLSELIAGAVLLATGLFFAWFSLELPFGDMGLPGPAFFPFVLGIALSLCALAILFQVWRHAKGGDVIYFAHRDVLITVAALMGVAISFEQADSYVVLGGFAASLLLLVARAAWWRVLLGAVLGMLAVWLFFGEALGVRLPVGEFWDGLSISLHALPYVNQQ